MHYLILNWKMNLTTTESVRLATSIVKLPSQNNLTTVICPSFSSLQGVERSVRGSKISLGAQDCYWENKGAYTGEESPRMLYSLGCRYVIIGHSERRACGETDEYINRKIAFLLSKDRRLIPILCIGESSLQRKKKRTKTILTKQLQSAFKGIDELRKIIIAYEPVWAIGSGNAANEHECAEAVGYIHDTLNSIFAHANTQRTPILYGGSVTPANVPTFIVHGYVQGILVGNAGLNVDSVSQLQQSIVIDIC